MAVVKLNTLDQYKLGCCCLKLFDSESQTWVTDLKQDRDFEVTIDQKLVESKVLSIVVGTVLVAY